LNLHDRTRTAIVAALKLNAKEARRKLELLAPKPVARKKGKAKRKKR
jgi:hypothetical protein